ncbi:LapA family protein [Pseudoxanthomonas spadix]|uniref:LapA family protein n=1 Tax=Pseudoxanthomonas spadix TaxID=415229 RepID=UPI000F00BCB2|nr:LapA family protein [Pseudoxanthomonas spadix]MBP3973672.1 LapA family protein [Pseudoxanthomonas spadix]RMW98118.1 LapA family protein [Pseudoxanthomonas spadix]
MNIIRLVIALTFLAIGLVIGILNTQPITLNLLFTQISTGSGAAIIVSLLAGVCIGALIVLATVAWPLYARLRKAGKLPVAAAPVPPPTTDAPPGSGV